MLKIAIEEANLNDLPAMSRLRAEDWGSANEWEPRVTAYMIHQQTPPYGLEPRTVLVAVDTEENEVIGMAAGHLSNRFGCQGEIHWLDVDSKHRGKRVGEQLVRGLFSWFSQQGAHKVCVTVTPTNDAARTLYARFAAEPMGTHWLIFPDVSSLQVSA
ncbi:MAG: GNAT family N-acetyltransferase [Acidobacteriaceae bacterium]|nr:GNAT family N-acetyltransferase [Acidobacteriaceae bacterium]